MALVHGLGQIVFNYGRPFALKFTDTTVDGVRDWVVPILYFDDLYNLYIRQGVEQVGEVLVNCAICEKQHSLDHLDSYRFGLDTFMERLLVPATGPNGKPWIWTSGHRRGQIRYQPIIACNVCRNMAQQFPVHVGQADVDWKYLLSDFLVWMKNEDLLEDDEKKSV